MTVLESAQFRMTENCSEFSEHGDSSTRITLLLFVSPISSCIVSYDYRLNPESWLLPIKYQLRLRYTVIPKNRKLLWILMKFSDIQMFRQELQNICLSSHLLHLELWPSTIIQGLGCHLRASLNIINKKQCSHDNALKVGNCKCCRWHSDSVSSYMRLVYAIRPLGSIHILFVSATCIFSQWTPKKMLCTHAHSLHPLSRRDVNGYIPTSHQTSMVPLDRKVHLHPHTASMSFWGQTERSPCFDVILVVRVNSWDLMLWS